MSFRGVPRCHQGAHRAKLWARAMLAQGAVAGGLQGLAAARAPVVVANPAAAAPPPAWEYS